MPNNAKRTSNMDYQHTQTGRLMIFVSLAIVLLFSSILLKTKINTFVFVEMFVILGILASFYSLNVIIDEKYLKIKFGYGIFKKRFLLKKIISAKAVKNHWYYGWGIRRCLAPPMWIYNVSGLDAVEIKMRDGKTYRIGTDEPENLEYAIMQAIKEFNKNK